MRIPQDERFRLERARFELRFCCESCALFEKTPETCALGFPNHEHRVAHYEDPTVEIVFCKDWELI